MAKEELDTPCLVVNLDALERNLARMAESVQAGLRPHIKTHKSPVLAKKQLAAGAIGITSAKVSEAEIMSNAGIRVSERSEAYTSQGGVELRKLLGVDVHHCAAVLFGLKVINYPLFRAVVTLLTQGPSEEGDGSPRRSQRWGSGLTAPDPNGWDGLGGRSRRKFWSAMKWLWRTPSNSGSGSEMGRPHGGYSAIPGSWGLSFLESLKSPFAYLDVKIC